MTDKTHEGRGRGARDDEQRRRGPRAGDQPARGPRDGRGATDPEESTIERVAPEAEANGAEAVSDEAIEELSGEAAAPSALDAERLMAERDDYLDHLRRLQAEFDNYRKRVRRDSEELRLRAAEEVVESLLPVIDNMQRALDAATKHEEGRLIEGVELVAGQLRSVLAGHGLQEVPTEPGMPFDPNVHEAVMVQESADQPEGTITQVMECGYTLHGRLLRPARVIVAE